MASARPTYSFKPNGNKLSFTVPSAWYAVVSSTANRDYAQSMRVSYNVMGSRQSVFTSPPRVANQPMKLDGNGSDSLSIPAQDVSSNVDVEFFFSRGASGETPSNGIFVVKAGQEQNDQGRASEGGIDTMTLFAFVEDASHPTGTSDTGAYNDAAAFVHLHKKFEF